MSSTRFGKFFAHPQEC